MLLCIAHMGKLFRYSNIAAFVRRRLELGYTAPKLAKELNMSPRVTRRLEVNGECAPEKFKRLCEVLDLQVSYFLPEDLQVEGAELAQKSQLSEKEAQLAVTTFVRGRGLQELMEGIELAGKLKRTARKTKGNIQ